MPKRSSNPILVTGTHRSGTTWAGRMLSRTRSVHYVHEPFAPMYERSWLCNPPTTRFLYQEPDDDIEFSDDLRNLVNLSPNWLGIAARVNGLRNYTKISLEAFQTSVSRLRNARALIKDPFLLLSAEWFIRRTNSHCLILVRHPAAFVSSIKRLNWRLDPNWLLNQPDLMRRFLRDYEEDLLRDAAGDLDIIEHACLIWNSLNSVTRFYAENYPSWQVVKYEKLATNPVEQFEELYDRFSIPWSQTVAEGIKEINSSENPAEVTTEERLEIRRNSKKAVNSWHNRLTKEEIEKIRFLTKDVSAYWYDHTDWPHYQGAL